MSDCTVYTRIALRYLKVSYSEVGEGGVAVNCEETLFFLNTLYYGCHFLPLIPESLFPEGESALQLRIYFST